jgi:hypothetical protein
MIRIELFLDRIINKKYLLKIDYLRAIVVKLITINKTDSCVSYHS